MASPGMRLDDAQRRDWLRLIRTENVGPRIFRNLVNRFGGASSALEALPTLARRGGSLITPRIPSAAEAEDEIAALARLGGRFIALGEPNYPPALRAIEDAPPLIAIRGRAERLVEPVVGIVGARNASGAGRTMTARLARGLGEAGFVVASGLARGIDTTAHEASLASGTIAVVAGGHDRPYPRENEALQARIAEVGVVLSEMPMGWEPRARDFPRRNRIVSGLSLGVVVVEAAERSGSLITARLAGEQGREVFAVPGSPLDPRAGGTNSLIKQGAVLVTDVADIIDVLRPMVGRIDLLAGSEEEGDAGLDHAEPADDARGRIVTLLGAAPVGIDELVVLSGRPAGEVQIVLLELELAGRLERHTGNAVSLI